GVHEIWQDGSALAVSTSAVGLESTGLSSCYYSLDNTYLSEDGGMIYPPPGDSYRPPVLVMPATWPSSVEVTINAVVYRTVVWLFGYAFFDLHYETTIKLPAGG